MNYSSSIKNKRLNNHIKLSKKPKLNRKKYWQRKNNLQKNGKLV